MTFFSRGDRAGIARKRRGLENRAPHRLFAGGLWVKKRLFLLTGSGALARTPRDLPNPCKIHVGERGDLLFGKRSPIQETPDKLVFFLLNPLLESLLKSLLNPLLESLLNPLLKSLLERFIQPPIDDVLSHFGSPNTL